MLPCLAWVVGAVLVPIGRNMSYYEMMIEQLLGSGAPQYGGEQGRRTAAADSSLVEDDMLRYQMGSKRKKGKNENIPSGSYALAEYPGLAYDIWAASAGLSPRGGMRGSTVIPGSDMEDKLKELRRQWAANQQSMMPSGNFVSRMGGR